MQEKELLEQQERIKRKELEEMKRKRNEDMKKAINEWKNAKSEELLVAALERERIKKEEKKFQSVCAVVSCYNSLMNF